MFLLPLSLLYEEPPKDVEMIYYVSQKENFVIKYPESNWEKVSFVSNGSTAKYVHVDADFNLAVFNPKMLKPGDLKKMKRDKKFNFKLMATAAKIGSFDDLLAALE